MSAFNLDTSTIRASRRLARRGRSDKGVARLAAPVEARMQQLLSGVDKPSMLAVHRDLAAYCAARGLRPPARASVYNALQRLRVPAYRASTLPPKVRASLYNLTEQQASTQANDLPRAAAADPRIPGDQLVFYAFNYGCPTAISYAAGLPWLCLHRAAQRRGWRPKSRALLAAILKYRGI